MLFRSYEAGEDLARTMIDQKAPNGCFDNNQFVCELLNGRYTRGELEELNARKITNPFKAYNLAVATENPRAWSAEGPPILKSKLLFQEYRFGAALRAGRKNKLAVHMPDGKRREIASDVVTIGFLKANEICLRTTGISRRHAVIVNFPDDVWIYDLASTEGTWIGDSQIRGRAFLDGAQEVRLGCLSVRIEPNTSLLV